MSDLSPILGPDGRPMKRRSLTDEIAAPDENAGRTLWYQPIASGLTPRRCAQILNDAANGITEEFLALAEEMEERDLHYRSVLNTRKIAITGIQPIVISADTEDPQAEAIADEIRELVEAPEFADDVIMDLLDGLGKGYSAVEIIWGFRNGKWVPAKFKWRDPSFFRPDKEDGETLLLKTGSGYDIQTEPLKPYRFMVHTPKLKSGKPIRAGLARLCLWAFMFKSFTLSDWSKFLEVFGMPLRIGRYDNRASEGEKATLLTALRQLSIDAYAMFPKGMDIELLEAKGGAGNAVFGDKAEYIDAQLSKAILGQTMTTDSGSSLSQAVIHEKVRTDLMIADARQTTVTVNRDLVRPYVDINHGPQKKYPIVLIAVPDIEDIKVLAEVIKGLVELGLEVSMNEVRKRLGFGEPEDGDKLLRPDAWSKGQDSPEAADPAAEKIKLSETAPSEDATASASHIDCHCPACRSKVAIASSSGADASSEEDELDAILADALKDWGDDFEEIIDPVRLAFEEATSYQDLDVRLAAMGKDLEVGRLASTLARAMMKARGIGNTGER